MVSQSRVAQVALILAVMLHAADAAEMAVAEETDCSCPRYGTAIEWAPTPEAAARMAREQSKLLLVLHISGNFEKNTFT